MGMQSRTVQEKRRKPHMIVTSKPVSEIRQAQRMAANFAYSPDASAQENEEAIFEMLDALGIRACVEVCCR